MVVKSYYNKTGSFFDELPGFFTYFSHIFQQILLELLFFGGLLSLFISYCFLNFLTTSLTTLYLYHKIFSCQELCLLEICRVITTGGIKARFRQPVILFHEVKKLIPIFNSTFCISESHSFFVKIEIRIVH